MVKFSLRTVLLVLLAMGLSASFSFAAEKVDNPAYQQWAKYKPGTWVKLKSTSEMAGQATEMEMTTKLLELNADKAVLEMTTAMSMGGQAMPPNSMKMDQPAKMDKVEMPKQPEDNTPKPEVKEGEETIKVGDKSYKCKTTETTIKQGTSTTWSKVWSTDEVPGGMVKMESKMDGDMKMTSKMEMVGVEIK